MGEDVTIQLIGVQANTAIGELIPDKELPPHKRSKRERLFRRNPHCYWCGRLTVFLRPKPFKAPDAATVDHRFSKQHPKRCFDGSTVLACYECNDERSKCEARGVMFIPKLACRRSEARDVSVVRSRENTQPCKP
jgi:hypothetical protein